MSEMSKARKAKRSGFRTLMCENLENRQLMAVDYAASIDLVRASTAVKRAESTVIATGKPMTIEVKGSIDGTGRQDHSFLKKTNVGGSYSGTVTLSMEKNVLVEKYSVRGNFTGRSRLDDIDLAAIAADVSVNGTYRLSVANKMPSRVLSTDWRSEATTNVIVMSGPTKGTDYSLKSLATSGREFTDKLSGLSTQELIANTVRNAIPLKTPLANWGGEVLNRLEKIKIPNVDVKGALAPYNIVIDVFAKPGTKSDQQIYQDALANKSIVIGVSTEADLLRFAQGGVTSVIGAKFNVGQSWDRVLTRIPLIPNAPLFGGLVTASLGAEANVGISVNLAGVFAADSRGWGLTAGTSATLKLRLEALLTGSVAIVGIDKWSLIGASVKAGAFVEGSFRLAVGSLTAKPDELRHGQILYVTSNNVQRGSFNSYLAAEISADVGAVLKTKVTILGITVWKNKLEKSWNVYKGEVIGAQRSLGQ